MMKMNSGYLKIIGAAAAVGLFLTFGLDASAQAPGKTAKPPSVCKGLAEAACKAKSDCAWITPKTGKQKPYCRTQAAKKK
jgi:hypothetical protein